MKTIEVVAAVIVKDGEILATQRGYGDLEGGWEFPGGKVEPGEAPEKAVVREIHEELAARVTVERPLVTVEHDYDTFHMVLRCYVCTLAEGERPTLLEHKAARWVDARDIDEVAWLPADLKVVRAVKEAGILGGR